MNTYTNRLLNDAKIQDLCQQLLDRYKEQLKYTSANQVTTELGENASFHLQLEGSGDSKLVLYFVLDDYYKYIEFGVNGIGYKSSDTYKKNVVTGAPYSFKDNGKLIPIQPLIKWIEHKGIRIPTINNKVPTVKQYAFMLSHSIKKHGLEPRHLLDKLNTDYEYVLDAINNRIIEIFNEEMNNELEKISDTIK